MSVNYIPNTDKDQTEMLKAIGIESIDELFQDIPEEVKLAKSLNLPDAFSELELIQHMRELSAENGNLDEYTCFLGAGAYDHFVPSVVRHIISRSEFYTSYTPYQAEASQGCAE